MEVRKTFHPPETEPRQDEVSYELRTYGYKIEINTLSDDTLCFQRGDSVFFTTQFIDYYIPQEPAYTWTTTALVFDTVDQRLDISSVYRWSRQHSNRGGQGSRGGISLDSIPVNISDDSIQQVSIEGAEAADYLGTVIYGNITNYGSGNAYLKEEVTRIFATDSTEITIAFPKSLVKSSVDRRIAAPELVVYPNPTNAIVTLANLNFVPTQARIIDATSRMVKEPKLESLAPVSYHIGDIPAGVYFLEVSNDAEVALFKIQVSDR